MSAAQVRVLFSGNITRHPAFREFYARTWARGAGREAVCSVPSRCPCTAFANADKIMECGFLLGAHHGITTAQVDRVCDLLIAIDSGTAGGDAKAAAAASKHGEVTGAADF
jgi:hypothetical protein